MVPLCWSREPPGFDQASGMAALAELNDDRVCNCQQLQEYSARIRSGARQQTMPASSSVGAPTPITSAALILATPRESHALGAVAEDHFPLSPGYGSTADVCGAA